MGQVPYIPIPAAGDVVPVPLPNEQFADIAQILQVLTQVIAQYKSDSFVRHSAVLIGSPVWPNDPQMANNIEAWVRARMIYVPDPEGEEFIVTPDRSLLDAAGLAQRPATNDELAAYDASLAGGAGKAPGDCDDMVVLCGSLLAAVGFEVRPAGAKVNGSGYFNHVILQLWSERGNVWQNIDCTTPYALNYGTLMIV